MVMTRTKNKLLSIEKQQLLLLNKINSVFPIYQNYVNKAFLFITEDGSDYLGYFSSKDFIHLTGISIKCSDIDFYNDIKLGRESFRSISEKQNHDNWTINKKIEIIKNFDSFVLNKCNLQELIIEDYRTLTTDTSRWSFALRNDTLKYTLCFNNSDSSARSIRKELVAPGLIRKKVICIFSRAISDKEYTKIEYLDSAFSISNILEKLYPRYCMSDSNNLKYNISISK